MYTALLERLDGLRLRTARFRKVALHLHSPDSHDWAQESGDPARNRRETYLCEKGESAFLGEINASYDLVAVTDHMKCGYACRLSDASHGSKDCVVLPGMEVNFKPDAALGCVRIHLVVVFPERSSKEDFAKIMPPPIPCDDRRTGQEEIEGLSLQAFVKRVHDHNGICIAAHVESKQGIRQRFRQTAVETLKLFTDPDEKGVEKANDIPDNLKQYLINSCLDAVEIQSADKACHYRWDSDLEGKPYWMPTILNNDAHCIEDFAKHDRVTHIKMTDRSLQGIKDALAFPETRIRFPGNLPQTPNPRLLGIQVKGGGESFFEDITVAFAENLNCLIGVRGSGKSTLVEALRYSFGYNRSLKEIGKSLEDSIKGLQQANLAGSSIRVAYRTKDGQNRILEATYDSQENYCTKVYSSTGEFINIPDVEQDGGFPLRLYGWSEIEALGRVPSKQRDLLDRLIPDIPATISRRKTLRDELKTHRSAVEKCLSQIKAAYESNNYGVRKYKEYKADFEKQNTDAVKQIFAALDIANEKRLLVKRYREEAKAVLDSLISVSNMSIHVEGDEVLKKGSDDLRKWWHEQGLDALGLIAVDKSYREHVDNAKSSLATYIDRIDNVLGTLDEGIAKLQDELKHTFAEDDSMQKIADLRANADRRLKNVVLLRDNYMKLWQMLEQALLECDEIAARLQQAQTDVSEVRSRQNITNERIMNDFLPAAMKVTIDFRAGKDTVAFEAILYKLFSNRSQQLRNIQALIAQNATPVEFAGMMLKGDFSKLINKTARIDGNIVTFKAEDCSICLERTKPFEKDEAAEVSILADDGNKLKNILDVQECIWDDYETILLNGGPVNEKSPGQRSSAMLPLIALAERTPLVIDQPEDNLDKRLIGTVLIKVLSELKEYRQILVCTHDPNILVGGDAEQVVVLEATSDKKGKVIAHGSIDNDDIVRTVIDLLEGGKQAFESRQKRYRNRVGR